MRPKSIVNFERIVILSILFGIVSSFLTRAKMEAMTAGQPHMSSSATLTIQIVFILIYLLLIYFISRKGSPVAKWIYVVLAVLGLLGGIITLPIMMKIGTLPLVIVIVQYALSLVSLWLLFRPDSKAWFSEGRTTDPADYR